MKLYFILFITVFFVACSSGSPEKTIKKPKHFLQEDEMVEITVDFRLTEAAIRQMAGYGEDTKVLSMYYYKNVFKKYHITAEEYKANLSFYAEHPEKIHSIYSRVVARLTEIQSELSTQK